MLNIFCSCYVRHFAILLLAFLASPNVSAQDLVEDPVVAQVGNDLIRKSRVERFVSERIGDRELSDEQLKKLRGEAVLQLVNRAVVLDYLLKQGVEASPEEIRFEIDLFAANLERVDQQLDAFLSTRGRTIDGLKREIQWKLVWAKYLEAKLSESFLVEYFDKNRVRFDGTEMKVAQILFRTLESDESVDAAIQLADSIKRGIENGETTWADSVRKNSVAPSREKDGELGWIRFKEPMPREFSDRAFGLTKIDEIAEPFASPFGVHLIKCLEIKPGVSGLGDVREEVVAAATRDLFAQIADYHRDEVEIEIRSN